MLMVLLVLYGKIFLNRYIGFCIRNDLSMLIGRCMRTCTWDLPAEAFNVFNKTNIYLHHAFFF